MALAVQTLSWELCSLGLLGPAPRFCRCLRARWSWRLPACLSVLLIVVGGGSGGLFLSREAVLPLGLAVGVFLSGLVGVPAFFGAVLRGGDVVLVILAFWVLARGLGASGFFGYVAFRASSGGALSLGRLAVGFYFLSGLLSCLVSNDGVVLMLAPVLVEVCRGAGVRDVRFLLTCCSLVPANLFSVLLPFLLSLGFGAVFQSSKRSSSWIWIWSCMKSHVLTVGLSQGLVPRLWATCVMVRVSGHTGYARLSRPVTSSSVRPGSGWIR